MRDLRFYGGLTFVFLLLAALSAWLQFGVREPSSQDGAGGVQNAPDSIVHKPVFRGFDGENKRYELLAERMTHDLSTDRIHLDRPRIVQFFSGQPPKRISADHGWLDYQAREVHMTGNVRVVEDGNGSSHGNRYQSDQMVILLDDRHPSSNQP